METNRTPRSTRLLWPLFLGLGLTLALLWVLMPHPRAVEAQAVNPGFTVDLVREVVWGQVAPGDTVTVTRVAGGPAWGTAQADGVGFFWTPLYDDSGQPAGLHGGDSVEIYVDDVLAAAMNPMTITGGIDVLADQVVGAISGDGGGTQVTVTLGIWAHPSLVGTPQVNATTDGSGTFTATFSADLGPHSYVRVEYADGPNTIQGYLYPSQVFEVDTFMWISGYATPGQEVTATIYVAETSNVRWSDTTVANWPHGDYGVEIGDIEPGDVAEVDLGSGAVISAVASNLTAYPDAELDRVTGTCPPNETVRVWAWNWRLGVYVETSTTADASGNYTATFAGYDLKASDPVYPAFADAEGDEVLLSTRPPVIIARPEQDDVGGSGDAPNAPYTVTLYHAPDTYVQTGDTTAAFNSIGWNDLGVDIAPGDVVTLETATWSGSMTVADLSFEFDTANDRVLGDADIPGWIMAWSQQWNDWQYPVHGRMGVSTTVSSPFTVVFGGFDLRDGSTLRLNHNDANDFITMLDLELRFFQAELPYGVGAPQFSEGDVLTATLYESDGVTLKHETSEDSDPDDPGWYWLDLQGMIEPGDWVSVTDDAGWSAGLQVPYLDVQAHEDDYIWGSGPTALLHVDYEREPDDWAGYFVPVNDLGNYYVLHTAFFGDDMQWGHRAAATYQAPNGNRVRRGFDWPQIVAHYDADGWNDVWGDHAFPGTYVLLTVTHPVSGVIATAGVLPGACDWCDRDDYNSQDLLPSGVIVPGNTVEAEFDDGYVDSVLVLPLDSEANPDSDVVTVTAPVSTPLHINADNSVSGWWDSDTQIVGASGYVVFDLGAEGYDIVPGTNFNVHSHQEHGHNTQYSFRLPAPDLRIGKWHVGNYARPGGVQVYGIYYTNEGDGVAENVLLVDTLPTSLTYLDDTSGIIPDISAGGVITWDLGELAPGEEWSFMLTLDVPDNMPTGSEVITPNCAFISTTTPESDWGDNEVCADPVDVWEDDVEIEVDKWVFPSDPTPGQELIYTIQWCNNRGAAAGPVLLTDTLPLNTSLLSWEPDTWWRRFWVEVSATDEQLVLYAPGLPGDTCRELYVTLLLDPGAPISTTLENEVVIVTDDDVYWDNNYRYNGDAHVSPPRYDLRLEKYFNSGVLAPGGWINYFVHYFNDGNMATNVSLQDTLPAGLSYDYAFWGGGQPGENEPLPDPIIVGNNLTWDLGTLPVGGSRWLHIQANIDGAVPPGTSIVNCATVDTPDGDETSPWDNGSCHTETVNDPGPNLRVSKSHWWEGDWRLNYDVRFENIGDETVSDVWISDYLPDGTAWNGWWYIDPGWDERLVTYTESSNLLEWNLNYLDPGDFGGVHFEADLDEPGLLMQWYTNTVEISAPPGDPTPWDNHDEDDAFSGMAQLMVWINDPDGNPAYGHVAIWDEWGGFVASRGARPDRPSMFADLEVGASYWVQAWPPFTERPAWANSVKKRVTIGDELIEFTLALQHPNITGVIRTPEGNALPTVYDDQDNPTYPAAAHIHNEDWSVDLEIATNPVGEFGMAMPDDDYVIRGEPAQELVFTYTKSLPHEVTASNVPQDIGEVRLTYPRVWGWVVDPDENPVSTWVNVWREDGEYWDGDDTFAPWEGDDPFRLGGLPFGHYYVQAESPWHNPEGYGYSAVQEFDVTLDSWYDPASTEQLTLTLRPANFVGDVLFPPGSHCPDCPVQWADVRLRDAGWNFERWRNTGEDGRVAFSGLEAGDYVVDVFLPDYLAIEWDPPLSEEFSLASPEDRVMRALYLQPATLNKHVIGEVRYDDGTPVGDADGDGAGDAWIYAHHWDSGGWTGVANEPDGSYNLDLKGGLWSLGVDPTHPGVDWYFDPDVGKQWVWFPYTPTLELFKTVVFTVTRAEFFHVTGWVDDPDGNPPPEGTAGVDLCTDEGDCFGAMVEASGRFTVPVLPGHYRVWVWADPDAGLLPPLHNGFEVFVGRDLDLGVLQLLDPADRTATVSGRVIITPTGQGAVGVQMEAWTDEGDWASTATITEGNYVLNLFPGNWHGGPALSPWQEENFVVLPPRYRHGRLKANQTISNVNFYVRYRDATIQGQLVNEAGELITDPELDAVVYAEFCPPDPARPCWIVAEREARGGAFELRVVGGVSYTLGVWVQSGRYLPGPREDVSVGIGKTQTGVQLTLVEAGTRIFGELRDGETGEEVQIEAAVYGGDSEGLYWVEDYVWPGKEPYEYELFVPTPTPATGHVTWTLGLWVDPSTGYIADPANPYYEVVIEPDRKQVWEPLKVKKLDTIISGTVYADGAPVPYIWVFAEGKEGLFEAETDKNGDFAMYVLPGTYMVGAYLPPHLAGDYFPPLPVEWKSVDDNPVNLMFRSRAAHEVEISGGLSVIPAGSIPDDAHIFVFGWTDDDVVSIATGTLASGYHLSVISDTTWHVWAAYEDLDNNAFYYTPVARDVDVGDTSVPGINLVLVRADFELPDTECWNFDPTGFKRLSLPAWGDLPEPLIEIPANSIPGTETVEVCATPKLALPGGPNMVGFAYDIEARDSQGNLITEDFNNRVRLIFYFDEAALPPGATPDDLIPAFYSTARQEWIPLEDVYIDDDDWFVTGKIRHFTKMGILSTHAGDNNIYLPLLLKAKEG